MKHRKMKHKIKLINSAQSKETAREEDENVIELDLAQEEENGKSEELENDYEEK